MGNKNLPHCCRSKVLLLWGKDAVCLMENPLIYRDDLRISNVAADVQAVITSFNQGNMIEEAIHSLEKQTTPPAEIIVIDDGSTDTVSLKVLESLGHNKASPIPVIVVRQENNVVSAARNAGIARTQTPLVLVLDGDDYLEPTYIEQVSTLLRSDAHMMAASSWMHTFGVLEAVVRPTGGPIKSFLPRNACPATHILRRSAWVCSGGYDETMRAGFEDWEFFLRLLETEEDASIGIVEQPLLAYRTAPSSANVKSMNKRLELMRYILEKHRASYQKNMVETLLAMEAISMARLYGWEQEMNLSLEGKYPLSAEAQSFLDNPSYDDGGRAAAVRIASEKKKCDETL